MFFGYEEFDLVFKYPIIHSKIVREMTVVGEGTDMMSLLYPQAFSFLSHSDFKVECVFLYQKL